MDREKLEQELRDYFMTETNRAEPSKKWWDMVTFRSTEMEQPSRFQPRSLLGSFVSRLPPVLIGGSLAAILMVILVAGLLAGSGGGMSPPPLPAPKIVTDGAGGAILVWVDRPYSQSDSLFRAQRIDAQGNFLWGKDGKSIAVAKLAVSDDQGGVIIAWEEQDTCGLERLDAAGNLVWYHNDFGSRSITGMVENGSGGVIALLENNSGMYACKVSLDGIILWKSGVLADEIEIEGDYGAVSFIDDGAGGAVLVWQEAREEGTVICSQRVNAEGQIIWDQPGVTIASIAVKEASHFQVVGDGVGNFIITWDTAQDNSDVYIQKLDDQGKCLWGEKGIRVCADQSDQSYFASNAQSDPRIVADGSGGVIIIWQDGRRILNREIFAQRYSSSGEALWTENGVWIWDIPADYPDTSGILGSGTAISGDGNGGATIIWIGYKTSFYNNSMIYAQRLDSNGQRLWMEEQVFPNSDLLSQGYASIINSGQESIIIGARAGEFSGISHTDSVYAQKINLNGDRVWGKNGKAIQVVPSAHTIQLMSLIAILCTALVLLGVFRGKRVIGVLTFILPIILGVAGLCGIILVAGPLSYTYSWAYIPDTLINRIAALIIPLSALVIGAIGIFRKSINLWIMIPVMLFGTLIAAIAALIFFF